MREKFAEELTKPDPNKLLQNLQYLSSGKAVSLDSLFITHYMAYISARKDSRDSIPIKLVRGIWEVTNTQFYTYLLSKVTFYAVYDDLYLCCL